jgi:hypothetical protein
MKHSVTASMTEPEVCFDIYFQAVTTSDYSSTLCITWWDWLTIKASICLIQLEIQLGFIPGFALLYGSRLMTFIVKKHLIQYELIIPNSLPVLVA